MPRSGPRPYECVRRAWHSERHKPMRGSLIKEIFRVVNEIHSSATKKNKEWQEKLPIVVLKAEEIMYSKANSEVEYMDLKTLWDRTNDAINTIIRRDESTETGEFLQPCIEAALNLGCIPRRASRSQRNTNPRCYLIPITSDVPSVSPSVVENGSQRDYTSNSQYKPHCSDFVKSKTINSTHLGFESSCPVVKNNDYTSMKFSIASENVPPLGYDQCFPRENQATSHFSSYPLYHGNFPQFEDLKHGLIILPKPISNPSEPAKMGDIPNSFCNEDKSSNSTRTDILDYPENPCTVGCDLSLRLGLLSSQSPGGKSSQPQDVKDVGALEGTKCSDQLPQLDKQFCCFDNSNEYGPRDSYSSRLTFEGEYTNVQATIRKRKAAFNHPAEDTKFCRQPELPFSYLNGSMRNGGL